MNMALTMQLKPMDHQFIKAVKLAGTETKRTMGIGEMQNHHQVLRTSVQSYNTSNRLLCTNTHSNLQTSCCVQTYRV